MDEVVKEKGGAPEACKSLVLVRRPSGEMGHLDRCYAYAIRILFALPPKLLFPPRNSRSKIPANRPLMHRDNKLLTSFSASFCANSPISAKEGSARTALAELITSCVFV